MIYLSQTRLDEIMQLLKKVFEAKLRKVTILSHYKTDKREYLKIKVLINHAEIEIREPLIQNNIVYYSYSVRIGNKIEWWNNRPHHKDIETFPHHRHVNGRILALYNHSLESFLNYVKQIVNSHQ